MPLLIDCSLVKDFPQSLDSGSPILIKLVLWSVLDFCMIQSACMSRASLFTCQLVHSFFLHESQADCIWSVPYGMLFEIGPNKSHVISTLGIKIIEKCNVKFLNSDLRVSITKYAD